MRKMYLLFLLSAVFVIGFAVSSATGATLDFTTAGEEGYINEGFFSNSLTITTVGTGNINSFLRLHPTGGDTVEDGFNTDGTLKLDGMDQMAGNFTHSITYFVLQETETTIGSTDYYEFLLDINQSVPSTLSLDALQIYANGSPILDELSDFDPTDLLWDLDVGDDGDSSILLDYSLNAGSGNGWDMFAYIPVSAFVGVADGEYIYLYAMFGLTGDDYGTNDGFEEWALNLEGGGNQPVPEPTTMLLLGSGLVGLMLYGRKRFRKETDKTS